ncbi:MAG: DUF1579 domain-containing protein [Gemmataceae bacterium]
MKFVNRIAILSVVLGLASGLARAQSPEEIAKAFAEASQPGPEHSKLEPLVGSWTYTCKMWMAPDKPPMECKGTIDRKWILGNRFVEETVKGTGFDGKPGFEGVGIIGYDKNQKQYTSNWICTMCTGTCTGVGKLEDGVFTFKTEAFCPMQKKVVQGREVLRFESKDRTVAESYMTIDGKEVKVMEITAVRKK